MPFAHDSITIVDSVSVSVKYPEDVRPWEEIWQVVEHALTALERRYASTDNPFDFGLLRNDALILFLTCQHVGDHLWSDPAVPLTQKDVRQYISGTEDLRLVEDFSNSFKHHTRDKPSKRLVRVDGFDSDPRAMWVGWTDDAGEKQRREALGLARGAVADWQKLLRQTGLL